LVAVAVAVAVLVGVGVGVLVDVTVGVNVAVAEDVAVGGTVGVLVGPPGVAVVVGVGLMHQGTSTRSSAVFAATVSMRELPLPLPVEANTSRRKRSVAVPMDVMPLKVTLFRPVPVNAPDVANVCRTPHSLVARTSANL
jgi:hypothetical protein